MQERNEQLAKQQAAISEGDLDTMRGEFQVRWPSVPCLCASHEQGMSSSAKRLCCTIIAHQAASSKPTGVLSIRQDSAAPACIGAAVGCGAPSVRAAEGA